MKKRWIIRSLFIAPLVLCVGAWVGSYWRCNMVSYPGRRYYEQFSWAVGRMGWMREYGGNFVARGWSPISWGQPDSSYWLDLDRQFKYLEAGFGYRPILPAGWFVTIPIWIPTLLCALLLWFVWRKTRPKMAGRAFPVEPAAKPGELRA